MALILNRETKIILCDYGVESVVCGLLFIRKTIAFLPVPTKCPNITFVRIT